MRNEKGFSLIELFAVILISTTVLVPLLFSLVGNFDVNTRMIRKNAASLVSISAIQGFETMPFRDVESINGLYDNNYLEFNRTNCDTLYTGTSTYKNSSEICDYVFGMTAQNITFDETEFRVFVYHYYMTQAQLDSLLALDDATIPSEVKDEIVANVEIRETVPDVAILRITVWIDYESRESDTLVRSGVIARD